jgi:hypothetical protein
MFCNSDPFNSPADFLFSSVIIPLTYLKPPSFSKIRKIELDFCVFGRKNKLNENIPMHDANMIA